MQTASIRERVVSMLANVADELAAGVALGLGIEVPEPMPMVVPKIAEARGHRVLFVVAVCAAGRRQCANASSRDSSCEWCGVVVTDFICTPHCQARVPYPDSLARLGTVTGTDGGSIEVEVSMEAAAVLFDALVVPDGENAVATLGLDGHTLEFLKDQYRHCKPILALGRGANLLAKADIDATCPRERSAGVLLRGGTERQAAAAFATAIGKHRHFARHSDPPSI